MNQHLAMTVILIAIILMMPLSCVCDGSDFQIWHTENQDMILTDHAMITAEEEFRWGDDARELFYQHYDFGAVCSVNKNMDIGVNYRLIYEKKSGKFKPENVVHANITPKLKLEPYAANEIFVDFKDRGGFTQNRLFGGLGITILKGAKAEFYYMLQSKKSSGEWKDADIFGSKFKVAF